MKKNEGSYIESVHRYGRVWMLMGAALMILFPVAACVRYDAWPVFGEFLQGMLGVAPIFWTVGLIEVLTYVPMLGTGGSYLGFVTGNMSNLKVPCAVNAMEMAKVKANSEEGELVSTIAIATSSIVTTVIIIAGVFLLAQLRPILEAPALQPAFASILPALFGPLAVVLIGRNWKIAIAPVLFMLLLFLFVPSLASAVALLVPVGILIALGAARVLYKMGRL